MKPTTKGGADDLETFAMENCLMLLATKAKAKTHHDSSRQPDYDTRCTYACKTCGKKFNSFQALGGHCASHRNNNNNKLNVVGESSPVELLRPKKHGCSICKVEFPTGQALGGHMRRHRQLVVPVPALTAERSTLTTEVSLENSDGNNKRTKDEEEEEVKNSRRKRVCLDLNLSEIEEEEGGETIILKRESDKQDIDDFLKLELRQPIRD